MSDTLVIDDTTYEITRLSRGPKEGEPYGLLITGGEELSGVAFLTEDEALDLRDFINVHLGVAPKNAVEQRVREQVARELAEEATRLEQTKHLHNQDQALADAMVLGVRHSAKLARGKASQ